MCAFFKRLIEHKCSHQTNIALGRYAKCLEVTQLATQGLKFKMSMLDQSDWQGRIHNYCWR